MENQEFLQVVTDSFSKFLTTGSRSNEKLKILHGAIARDLEARLDDPKYHIAALGIGNGKEQKNGNISPNTMHRNTSPFRTTI